MRDAAQKQNPEDILPGNQTETNYSIVALEEKDAAELAALELACFSTAWTGEQYRAALGAAGRGTAGPVRTLQDLPPFMVFGLRYSDKKLAAYISLMLHPEAREIEIYNIAVRQSLRRKYCATVLLRHILSLAQSWGVLRAVLEVRSSNVAALALYAQAGFLECGRRKGYYADTGEDALILGVSLKLP